MVLIAGKGWRRRRMQGDYSARSSVRPPTGFNYTARWDGKLSPDDSDMVQIAGHGDASVEILSRFVQQRLGDSLPFLRRNRSTLVNTVVLPDFGLPENSIMNGLG